jgi:hypothetical protein
MRRLARSSRPSYARAEFVLSVSCLKDRYRRLVIGMTKNEWVIVLNGSARLAIAGERDDRLLREGDAIFLRARCRHRVTWTDPDVPTVWLALFIDAALAPS